MSLTVARNERVRNVLTHASFILLNLFSKFNLNSVGVSKIFNSFIKFFLKKNIQNNLV